MSESAYAKDQRKASETQVGGSHYKDMVIQPTEFCQKNKLNFCESNVVKYICRWRSKGGLEDLKKVKHYVDLLIEIEGLEDEKTP
jgi:hypothetical protein